MSGWVLVSEIIARIHKIKHLSVSLVSWARSNNHTGFNPWSSNPRLVGMRLQRVPSRSEMLSLAARPCSHCPGPGGKRSAWLWASAQCSSCPQYVPAWGLSTDTSLVNPKKVKAVREPLMPRAQDPPWKKTLEACQKCFPLFLLANLLL